MKACTTAGGGVMFIPDTIERKGAAISYSALAMEEASTKRAPKSFGKRTVVRKANGRDAQAAA